VLLHAMVPIVPEQLPVLAQVPVFLAAGRADKLITPAQTEQLAKLLRQAGADVTLHWETSGHAINPNEVRAAASWLRDRGH